MQFDAQNESWQPTHDPEVRLRSPWTLAIALAIVALGTAFLIPVPEKASKPRTTVSAMLP
jgi:hypothetical protein